MIQIEFKYSHNANYPYPDAFKVKSIEIINQNIVIISDNKDFSVSFQNVFGKCTLPYVESDAIVQRWRSNWMQIWQNQLNFAYGVPQLDAV